MYLILLRAFLKGKSWGRLDQSYRVIRNHLKFRRSLHKAMQSGRLTNKLLVKENMEKVFSN